MSTRQAGFTLVEVLVALAVASLLISLTFGSIVIGERSARALSNRVDDSDLMLTSWHFLQHAISEAYPVTNNADSRDRTGFYGNARELSFVANLPAYAGAGGPTRIVLGVTREGDKRQLKIRLIPYPPPIDEDQAAPIAETELLDDIESLQLSYLGQTKNGEIGWRHEWSDPRYLPNLIRIQINPANAPSWPAFVFRPLSGTDPISTAYSGDDLENL